MQHNEENVTKKKNLSGTINLLIIAMLTSTTSLILAADAANIPSDLREGDLIYVAPENKLLKEAAAIHGIDKGGPGHIGIIVRDENNNLMVRHAHPDFEGKSGVFNTPVENFVKHYPQAEFLKVNVDKNIAKKAAEYAKTLNGDFQLDWDELKSEIGSNSKWYCAELVYVSYLKGTGTNLVNRHFFSWVSPRDIRKSNLVAESGTKDLLGGINFSSINIAYINTESLNSSEGNLNIFEIVLKATKENKTGMDLEDTGKISVKSFLIGLSFPNEKFWVNLNPWEPDRIIEKDLQNTDVGRIMLEADLRMKKSFSEYENPCESNIGEEYWKLLEEKREELIKEIMKKYPDEIENVNNVLFASATRHWIVPDRVEAFETDNEIYITNASLKIYSEPVYEHSTYQIVNQNIISLSKGSKDDLNEAAKEYGRYVKELEEKVILPFVVKEVNRGKNYSDLRQVYISLALAQWYKNKYRHSPSMFVDYIDSKDLEGLEAKSAWSSENIWKDYKKSFEEGDFHCWKNKTFQQGNRIITESNLYSGGGVDFMDIKITNMGNIPHNLKESLSEAVYSMYAKEGNDYYFGDGLYVYEDIETVTQENSQTKNEANNQPEQKTPGFETIFAIAGLLTAVYLARQGKF